ncbi:MAG: YitT family protein, partial [Oscillospiraceae bacterium]
MANTNHSKFKFWARYLIYNFVGSYLYAAGVHVFTRPHNIAPGGITGIATILNYLTDFPIGLGVTLLNLPLVALAAKFISKTFAAKTIGSLAIFTVCADYLVKILPQYNGDSLLATLFGGAIMGVGL